MVLRQVTYDPGVPEQPADVGLYYRQLQMVLAVGFLNRGDPFLQPG